MVIELTSGKGFAGPRWTVEQDCKTAPFTAHYITEARFLQPIRFHHSFNDPLVVIPNNQSSEGFLAKLDRLEVIHLY